MATLQPTASLPHLPYTQNHQAASNLSHTHPYTQPILPLHTLISMRPQPFASDRHNKSTSLRTIGQLKQILSRSLLSNKMQEEGRNKQKSKEGQTVGRSDSKPISPQSQQREPIVVEKSQVVYQMGSFCQSDVQARFSNTNELLDSNFNRILELNLLNEKEMDLQMIESKFIVKMQSQKEDTEVDQDQNMVVPNWEHVAAHEKLLEEENAYIREQLILFTETIDQERILCKEMKHKAKKYSRENTKLKEKNTLLLEELTSREEKYYTLSIQNDEYAAEVTMLRGNNLKLMQKMQELTRQCQECFARLENYEGMKEKQMQEKNRQKEALQEELHQRERQIELLEEEVGELRRQLGKGQDKVICSIQSEEDEQIQRSSSICLSLAQAESLKLIIENKEQMFQQEVETLKRRSIIVQNESSAKIEKLALKIKQYQTVISQNETELSTLRDQLVQEQALNEQLSMKIMELQRRGVDNEQDEQLQDLLEGCMEELQRERAVSGILREQIGNLKRLFAQEMYYVQQIQQHICSN